MKYVKLFIIWALTLGVTPVFSALLPFEAGSKFVICQGYNTSDIDHVETGGKFGNYGTYGLDFVVDTGGKLLGKIGCSNVAETVGKKIIAPAAGKVRVVPSGVCLRLDRPYGLMKSINFYHVTADGALAGAKFDVSVTAGQALGVLEPAGAVTNPVPHLHLAAFTDASCSSRFNTTPFNDFFDGLNLDAGFVGAEPAILQHRGTKVVAPLVPVSNLSSTGSVVDPQLGGSCTTGTPGCYYDLVRLQPAIVSSSGAFQVLSQAGICQVLEISQDERKILTELYISVKRFDESYPGHKSASLSSIYKTKSLPVRIKLPPNKFMVVKVTTPGALAAGKAVDITAKCVNGSFQQAPPGDQLTDLASAAADRVEDIMQEPLDDGSYWGGAASLIGYSGNVSTAASRNGFTKDKDDIVKLSTRKSTITLQAWRSRSTCLRVRFDNATGKPGALADLNYKLWDSKEWIVSESQALPITVDLKGDGFWVFRLTVKNPTEVKRIFAQCLK